MTTRYPFKFLDAYTREDREFFFGRDEEVDQLYKLSQQGNIIALYGAAGTGKTSLIQCGLASKFKTYDWMPLFIRRGKDIVASLDMALCDESDGAFFFAEQEQPEIPDLAAKIEAVYLASFKPLYLIFDQFEELYILAEKAEQTRFIHTFQQLLLVDQPVKLILSIREEYLGHLYDFERAVPDLLRKKLRVEPMNLDKVTTVIRGVGSRPSSNVGLLRGEEDAIAQGIFDKIRGGEKSLSIPLPYLQVFLDKLYLTITGDETRQEAATFTSAALQQMGDIGDVLRAFLDEQVLLIAGQMAQSPDTLWSILSPFVTLEGTKEPLSGEQLHKRLPDQSSSLITGALGAFVTRRILRYTERDQLYEIAHDSLARQIHARRSDEEIALLEVQRLVKGQTAMNAEAREYFTEKQLLFMDPYLERLVLGEAEKDWVKASRVQVQQEKEKTQERQAQELTETRRRLRVVRGLLFAALLALLTAAYFWNNAQQEKQRVSSLLQENLRKDNLNQLEKYNRFMAEGRNAQSQAAFEQAIEKYGLAKEFARDTQEVASAIAACRAAADRQKRFEEHLTRAAEARNQQDYEVAVAAYEAAAPLDVNTLMLRNQLADLRTQLQEQANDARDAAEALSFNPIRADFYRRTAARVESLIRRNNILQSQLP